MLGNAVELLRNPVQIGVSAVGAQHRVDNATRCCRGPVDRGVLRRRRQNRAARMCRCCGVRTEVHQLISIVACVRTGEFSRSGHVAANVSVLPSCHTEVVMDSPGKSEPANRTE